MISCPSPSGCRFFYKNILEQKSSERRETMVSYLGDLMKDATDFSWLGQKQPMRCCYVKWSRVPSSGKTWIVLTVSIGPMLRNTYPVGQRGANPWITQGGNHGTVKMTRLVLVITHVTMNLMGKFTNTFALLFGSGQAGGASRKGMPE